MTNFEEKIWKMNRDIGLEKAFFFSLDEIIKAQATEEKMCMYFFVLLSLDGEICTHRQMRLCQYKGFFFTENDI